MNLEVAIRAAASAGLGTATSAVVSELARELARQLRIYAQTLAQDIEAMETRSQQVSVQLQGLDAVRWNSEAATLFRKSAECEVIAQEGATRSFSDAATKTRAAGESLAQELEALSGSIAEAGRAVDSQIREVGKTAEGASDLLSHHSVKVAQSSLDSLLHNPLISSVQSALSAGGFRP